MLFTVVLSFVIINDEFSLRQTDERSV